MGNGVNLTGWISVAGTEKRPFGYRFIVDKVWLSQPAYFETNQDDNMNKKLGIVGNLKFYYSMFGGALSKFGGAIK